jgi:hypothetical protein
MNKYSIQNQYKSSFTIYRKHMVDVFNYITEIKNNRITDKTKHTPTITIESIPTRTDLIEFVKNFNKNENK